MVTVRASMVTVTVTVWTRTVTTKTRLTASQRDMVTEVTEMTVNSPPILMTRWRCDVATVNPELCHLLNDLAAAGVSVCPGSAPDKVRLSPRSAVTDDLLVRVREQKQRLIDLLNPPSFPSPTDWINGERITVEAVGFDRFQYGGRPHCLRPDLRRIWLDTYTEAMQITAEPEAWREAWAAVHDRSDSDE